jgi:tetratricopeptide (TPR) repeat protein
MSTPEPTHGQHVVAGRDAYLAGRDQIVHIPAEPVPVPRQLPPDTTHFTGRSDSLANLDALLHHGMGRSVTTVVITAIAGTAGVGKTALAVHWAHRVRSRFPDGDLYVNLHGYDTSSLTAAEEALEVFLRALNVPAEKIPVGLDARIGLYRSMLEGRRILLVLDNAASAEQVRPLLPGSSTCFVVVTSRSNLSGLVVRDGAKRLTIDPLPPAEAMALLQQIIGADRVGCERAAAAELARLCAYLPLTLRIAAERVAIRPRTTLASLVMELAVESDRLDLFATADHDESTAARSVFSWSYRALPREAARTFRLLGLHAGPDIGVLAAAALTGISTTDISRLLDSLLSMHLLERVGEERFRFHDLLRVYAAERAEIDEGEQDRAKAVRRVLTWYLHAADAADRFLSSLRHRVPLDPLEPARQLPEFENHSAALDWCEAERLNLVTATRQAVEIGLYSIAWKLPNALWGFLSLRKYWTDWIITHEHALTAAQQTNDRRGEAWTLGSLADAYRDLRRFEESIECLEQGLAICREIGDRWAEGIGLTIFGAVYLDLGQPGETIDYSQRALAIFLDINDRWGEGIVLNNLGEAYRDLQRFEESIDHLQRALVIRNEIGDQQGKGTTLNNLGEAQCGLRQFEESIYYLQRALVVRREIGDQQGKAITLTSLGTALRDAGRLSAAYASWRRALAIFDDLGSPQAVELRGRIAAIISEIKNSRSLS